MVQCARNGCEETISRRKANRKARFCSGACRAAAYRERQTSGGIPGVVSNVRRLRREHWVAVTIHFPPESSEAAIRLLNKQRVHVEAD